MFWNGDNVFLLRVHGPRRPGRWTISHDGMVGSQGLQPQTKPGHTPASSPRLPWPQHASQQSVGISRTGRRKGRIPFSQGHWPWRQLASPGAGSRLVLLLLQGCSHEELQASGRPAEQVGPLQMSSALWCPHLTSWRLEESWGE